MTRPWKATAEQVAKWGDSADYWAWNDWMESVGVNPETGQYWVACAVADAMAPTFRAGVIADFLDDCWERGSPPTPEEIEPFLRPKVRELVWDGQFAHATTVLDYCVYETATGLWNADLESGEAGGPILWQRIGFDSRELAQAAAQAHWHERAMAFWKEAFVT